MATSGILKTCIRCERTIDDTNFYQYRDGSKVELCKKCFTAKMNAFKPETFLWALEKLDVIYMEDEWNVLRDRAYNKDPKKFSSMAVFGKYLSKTKLGQWKDLRWADTEAYAEKKAKEKESALSREEELKDALEKGNISEAEYNTFINTKVIYQEDLNNRIAAAGGNPPPGFNPFEQTEYISEDELPDIAADLTLEDKQYLALKWGRTYKPAEWVTMEQDYMNMKESFDIHDADSEMALIQLCKANLQANQALDSRDIDGFQKLSRALDGLRKSAKFTAAQKKEEKKDAFTCYGHLVAFAEKEGGFIPRLDLSVDRDIADRDLRDIKKWSEDLIRQDPAVFKQIEQYIKKREIAEKQERDRAEAEARGEEITITDKDFTEYNQFVEEGYEEDNE